MEEHISRIMNEYERLRTKARQDRDMRVQAVYTKVPEILEIDQKINRAGFENTKKIMQDPENSSRYNMEFNKLLFDLTREKQNLLAQNQIDPDYEKIVYKCPDCEDTGYTKENTRCKCFAQRLIDFAYQYSNLSEVMDDQDFEHFVLDYYLDQKEKGENSTQREIMQHILNHCKMFCRTFSTYPKSLLFYGGTGVGKTFMSSAVAKEVLKQGKTVLYIRATRLFNLYDDYKFSRTDDQYIKAMYDADLLIIDDLGTEFLSKTSVPFLFDLINDRLSKGKKLIINTNLTMQDMEKAYTPRFVSRLYESFDILKFSGRDIRIEKFKNFK